MTLGSLSLNQKTSNFFFLGYIGVRFFGLEPWVHNDSGYLRGFKAWFRAIESLAVLEIRREILLEKYLNGEIILEIEITTLMSLQFLEVIGVYRKMFFDDVNLRARLINVLNEDILLNTLRVFSLRKTLWFLINDDDLMTPLWNFLNDLFADEKSKLKAILQRRNFFGETFYTKAKDLKLNRFLKSAMTFVDREFTDEEKEDIQSVKSSLGGDTSRIAVDILKFSTQTILFPIWVLPWVKSWFD